MLSTYDIVALHCSVMILLYMTFLLEILPFVMRYHEITLRYCNMINDAKNIAIHKYSGPGFSPTGLRRK